MIKSKTEASAGIVLLNPQKKVLVGFKKWTKVWEFPQGKIREGESLFNALKREIQEETGIKKFRLVKDFQVSTHYSFQREGFLVHKTVTYFLGITKEKVKLSEEHEQYRWCTFEEANMLFTHENHKQILKEVARRLEQPLEFLTRF